jgi:hypothetical protein
MYMTAEQAKRGLEILDRTPLVCDDTDSALGYHDLSLQSVFDPYVVK